MKKKLFALILTSFALSIMACQTEKKNEGGNTPSIDYTVNESEFNSASNLRYKNLTYTVQMSVGGVDQGRVEMRFLADGSSHQVECTGWPELYYKVESDDSVLYIRKNSENTWYVDQIRTKQEYEQGNYGDDAGFIRFIDSLSSHYSDFTYNESNNTYAGSIYNTWAETNFDYVVKFENKEIASMTISMSMMGQTGTYEITVKNRGITVIDFDSLHYINPF